MSAFGGGCGLLTGVCIQEERFLHPRGCLHPGGFLHPRQSASRSGSAPSGSASGESACRGSASRGGYTSLPHCGENDRCL